MTLKECDSIDLTRISSPNDYIAAASSTETLEQIEEVVTAWIKQIEQVLVNGYLWPCTIEGFCANSMPMIFWPDNEIAPNCLILQTGKLTARVVVIHRMKAPSSSQSFLQCTSTLCFGVAVIDPPTSPNLHSELLSGVLPTELKLGGVTMSFSCTEAFRFVCDQAQL